MRDLGTYAARLVRKSFLAQSSEDGFEFHEGYQNDAQEPDPQYGLVRFQHYGFRSRPPVRSEIVALSINGGKNNRVYIASEAPGQGPTQQKEGEVELYSQFGQRIRMDKFGTLTAEVSAGAKVTLSNNTVRVHNDLVVDNDATVQHNLSVGNDAYVGNDATVSRELTVGLNIETGHYLGRTLAPPQGSPASVLSVAGTDAGFTVTISATMPIAGPLGTITFTRPYNQPPHIGTTYHTPALLAPSVNLAWTVTPGAIVLAVAMLPVGTYKFSVVVIG